MSNVRGPSALDEEEAAAGLEEDEGRTDEIADASPEEGWGRGFARMVWVVGMFGAVVFEFLFTLGDEEDVVKLEVDPALERLEETDPGLKLLLFPVLL